MYVCVCVCVCVRERVRGGGGERERVIHCVDAPAIFCWGEWGDIANMSRRNILFGSRAM